MGQLLLDDEKKLLDSIRSHFFAYGYSPSIQELVESFGRKSRKEIQSLLDQLQEKGYVDREKNKSRSIRLIAGNIPLRGVIQAGYVEEQPSRLSEYIDVSGAQYTVDDYALEVKGDSMIDAHIRDGDFVILRPIKEIDQLKAGTITAVWVEGSGTTLKYLYQEGHLVILEAANKKYEPQKFSADQVYPQGVLVGLHRIYDVA